nr:immunoglobulin light chain junction region [Macaca mulatta]MOV95030.1 immunoglobulin light chain junction region [Macaca mulatta]MOV95116.1 immunoglobulin light chain junction region [Macaca mulatta]MOV95343.1 immunoglobulin light chain junction region [Macaca mulatta]MOV95476.1 immunoglobulin light chain junction region [Macaca mulatta]
DYYCCSFTPSRTFVF